MELVVGQVYADKYRVLRVLGQGSMGSVYEAENLRIQRKVAIKALHPGLLDRRDTVMRFEMEAQAAGRIGSHHITEVLDTGELHDGTRFMVMEFLDGVTLHERIRSRGRLTPEEIAPLVVQLLEGLGAAHDAGIVHRDLKPANVFIARTQSGDFVKVLDFGVSKFNVLDGGEGMAMTSTGMILGTPFYMSPEQAKGSKGIDGRSDLYSVGVILYEAITGQVPFSAETFNELIFRIVLESPPPAEQFVPDLDGAFAVILRKSMNREVEQRFQTAAEFRGALTAWIEMSRGPSIGVAQGGTVMMTGARGGTLMLDGAPTTPFSPATKASAGGPPPPVPSSQFTTQPFPAVPGPPQPIRTLASPVANPPPAPPPPPNAIAAGDVAALENSPARRSARFASGTVVAVVIMTVAAATMGGAAAVIMMRGKGGSAQATPADTSASTAAPSATAAAAPTPSAPETGAASAPPASGAPSAAPEVASAPSAAPSEAAADAPAKPTPGGSGVSFSPSDLPDTSAKGAAPSSPRAPAPAPRPPSPVAKAPPPPSPVPAPAPAPAPATTKRSISGDL